MLNNLTGWHFLIILVVVLLLFGAPKLPGLARSLGQSMKIFKSEITPERTDEAAPSEPPESYRPTSNSAGTSPRTDSRAAPHPKV
jgi:sec-independent protein translocase protein TatA